MSAWQDAEMHIPWSTCDSGWHRQRPLRLQINTLSIVSRDRLPVQTEITT